SSSPKLIECPMFVNAGRLRYFAKDCSRKSRSDGNSLTSISAGTPSGYSFSQIFSIVPPPDFLSFLFRVADCSAEQRFQGRPDVVHDDRLRRHVRMDAVVLHQLCLEGDSFEDERYQPGAVFFRQFVVDGM